MKAFKATYTPIDEYKTLDSEAVLVINIIAGHNEYDPIVIFICADGSLGSDTLGHFSNCEWEKEKRIINREKLREEINSIVGENISNLLEDMGCALTCIKAERKALDIQEVLVGQILDLITPKGEPCKICKGKGEIPQGSSSFDGGHIHCKNCNGSGIVESEPPLLSDDEDLFHCIAELFCRNCPAVDACTNGDFAICDNTEDVKSAIQAIAQAQIDKLKREGWL